MLVWSIGCVHTSFFYQNLSFRVPVWPWKRDKGHQNLITSFPNPNDIFVLVWSNSIYWFMRQSAHKAHFLSIYNVVTLKIRSRSSPKSNQFFPQSIGCICASLVKFQPLVKEIMHTQTFYCIKKAHFLSIHNVVTLKIRSRPSESNHFFHPPYDVSVLVWSNSSHWLKI